MCQTTVVVNGRYVTRKHLFAPKWRQVEEIDGFAIWQNSAAVEREYAVSESWALYPTGDEVEFSCASLPTARSRARFLAKCVREPKVSKPKATKAEKKPSQKDLFAGELAELRAAQVRLLAELDQVRAELAESRESRKARKAKV